MSRTLFLTAIGAATMLLGAGCAEEYRGREPLSSGLHYPLGMAVDSENGRLYVVNSNFDLAYRQASVVSISLDTHTFDAPHAFLESFPGEFLFLTNSAGTKLGYLAVRGDNSVTWFKVASGGTLDCGNLGKSDPAVCVDDHVVVSTPAPDGYDPDVEELDVGSDPYGLAWIPGRQGEPDRLVSAAMRDGTLTLMDLADDGTPAPVHSVTVTGGLHSVAVDPVSRQIYVTTKTYPVVYRYEVQYVKNLPQLTLAGATTIPSPFSTNDFGRGLAITPDGRYALVATRTPPALVVLDATDSPLPESQRAVKVIPLDGKPGQIRIFNSGPDGAPMAYVLGFTDDRVWAFDTKTFQPRASFRTGAGPYDMAASLDADKKVGYVSNFLDHTISIVDLDPNSDTYHTVIGEIQP